MPAEWEKQQSTLIGWPYNKNDWPGKFKNIPNVFAKIIPEKITEFKRVFLVYIFLDAMLLISIIFK